MIRNHVKSIVKKQQFVTLGTSHLLNVSSPVSRCISLSATRGMSRDDEHTLPCCPFHDWLSLTPKPPKSVLKTSKQNHIGEENPKTEADLNLFCAASSSLWRDNPQTSPSSEPSDPQQKTPGYHEVHGSTSRRHSTPQLPADCTVKTTPMQVALGQQPG